MPELPDVEVNRRYLESTSLHQAVAEVHVDRVRVLNGTSPQQLGAVLHGKCFEGAVRHGKHLLVHVEGGPCLHLHFGMTGRLAYRATDSDAPEHTRASFVFDNGYVLLFDNQRLLGEISLVDSVQRFVQERDLGPDALDAGMDVFVGKLKGRGGMVKSGLMHQPTLAGIGNAYSDEILFQARLHPRTPLDDLGDDHLADLHGHAVAVLETAIDAHADPDALPAGYLLPHRRPGASCPRCGTEVDTVDVSGRAGYFCSSCQASP
jgi:formamidopyrimidine-DNA glycosylase